MASHLFIPFAFVLILAGHTKGASNVTFDQNYYISWAADHVSFIDQGREIQLSLDPSSGAGFVSKQSYATGFFHARMKLPATDSTGVITTFYLSSSGVNHDELDIEFLGDSSTLSYTLQTNVYANGKGDREQRIHLWFDPVADFHDYQILWNQHQIVFFVDNIPIRVFKNNTNIGVSYPSQPMQIQGTIWTAGWASVERKINWTQAPFQAQYRGFNIQGCQFQTSNPQQCHSNFWWSGQRYWRLSPDQQRAHQNIRNKYMYYDYCSDKSRYPNQPPECQINQQNGFL